jgi:hypothetical protein
MRQMPRKEFEKILPKTQIAVDIDHPLVDTIIVVDRHD